MAEGMSCPACRTPGDPGDRFCQRCGGRLVEANGAQLDGRPRAVRPAAGETVPDGDNEATRFLCVGAYLDDRFASRVLGELFGKVYHAVAPSYGYDVVVVAEHCLAARHRRRIRDLVLVALAVAMFLIGAVPAVVLGTWAWVLGLIVGALREGPDGLRRAIYRLRWQSVLARLVVALLVSWLWGVLAAIWTGVVTAIQVGSSVANGSPDLNPLLNVIGSPGAWLLVALGWLALYGVVLADLIVRREAIVRDLRRAPFRARADRSVPMATRLRKRLDTIASEQTGNATIYSGFDPFVGTGQFVPGWSFAMPLVDKQGHEGAAERFSVTELVDHVRAQVVAIAAGEEAAREDALRGLVVSDHVFVSGLAIEGDERFFTQRAAPPRVHLAADEIRRIASAPQGAVRHYCSVAVQSWGGEVVAFMLFHFSTDGQKLYFECVKRVLPPVRREYHRVDAMGTVMSGAEFVRTVTEAGGRTVPAVVGLPARLIGDLAFDLQAETPPYGSVIDYGAHISAREVAAEGEFHNYFQELDADKHLKIVERHVMAAIAACLDEHGIDSSEFRDQQANITNYNTINQTGENNFIGASSMGGGRATSTGDARQRSAGAAPRGGP